MDADSFYIVLPLNTLVSGNRTSDYLVKFPILSNLVIIIFGSFLIVLIFVIDC